MRKLHCLLMRTLLPHSKGIFARTSRTQIPDFIRSFSSIFSPWNFASQAAPAPSAPHSHAPRYFIKVCVTQC